MRIQHRIVFLLAAFAVASSLAVAETSPTPTASANAAPETGLEGNITISPIHGGPVRVGQPSVGPLPNTAFVVRQEDRIVATFTTDAQGAFRVVLPPGQYAVAAQNQRQKFGNYGPWPIEVVAGKMTKVTWDCDSGLR